MRRQDRYRHRPACEELEARATTGNLLSLTAATAVGGLLVPRRQVNHVVR